MNEIDACKVFAVLYNKSAIYFTADNGRDISCSERKSGECCEQNSILSSHCLDLHDQMKEKLFEKLVNLHFPWTHNL